MLEKKRKTQVFYPDVLGAVTGGNRLSNEHLQFAFGIFPRQSFINQPFEAVIVLQSTMSHPMQVKIALRLPSQDQNGAPAVIDSPNQQILLTLQAGEVGVLRIPMVARPPTRAGKDFPVRLAVRTRIDEHAESVRPPAGGAPPSVLAVSPFKVQALRDITFDAQHWNHSSDVVTAHFDLVPQRLTQNVTMPKMRYEILWSREQMPQEMARAHQQIDSARRLADSAQFTSSYGAFLKAVNHHFGEYDMPLHPGEAMAIAKMMAYTLDEAPKIELTDVEDTRWFAALCQVLAARPELKRMDRNELMAQYVFNEVLYESILMGFHVIESKVKEDLGSAQERLEYANRVMAWLGGRGAPDLNYVYLPLVLGGLTISRLVRSNINESPWDIVDSLTEAMQGRIRLADDATVIVFEMLNAMLRSMSILLRNQRVNRY
jgi:hypothetical protein